MVVGIFCGLFIRYAIPGGIGPKVAQLDPKLFFIVFLPCIVFDAAYNCNKVNRRKRSRKKKLKFSDSFF